MRQVATSACNDFPASPFVSLDSKILVLLEIIIDVSSGMLLNSVANGQ